MQMGFGQSKKERFDMSRWPQEQLRRAREKADAHELCSDREKEVIYYCNLVRVNGPLFEKTILQQYLDAGGYSGDMSYVNSLKNDLRKLPVDEMPMFEYNEKLFQTSKKYAIEGGKKGIVGHDGFSKRMKYFYNHFNCIAENCSYGDEDGFDAFMSLLIDEGIVGLGHRQNLLNKDHVFASAAFAPHKKYEVNMVMDFACMQRD